MLYDCCFSKLVSYCFLGKFEQFNVSWLRGGHPVLDIGDLSVKASQSLGLLLDQLRSPAVKSITNLMIIVVIKW